MRGLFLGAMLAAGVTALAVGCGGSSTATKPTSPGDTAKGDTKHEGWWCDEHGVKEEVCSMCSAKMAKEFKAKGDWCDKHNRAQSQCFICKPELREQFAAEYKAKYNGKEPPEPTDNMPEKK